MKKSIATAFLTVAVMAALAVLVNGKQVGEFFYPEKTRLKRGEYLVKGIGCSDCHTPLMMGPKGPEPDMDNFLAGHPASLVMPPFSSSDPAWAWAGSGTNTAFAGPWGVSYAPNLTPDLHTGLGVWTEEMFLSAMKTGKHMGASRPIMPPMPWPAYANLSDKDLKAIFAYLRTLDPVENKAPDWQPPASN